jgi:hypothetical protein
VSSFGSSATTTAATPDSRLTPDSLGSEAMGRGSRPVKRWRNDRKKQKKEREKRKLAAVARPSRNR